MVSLSMLKIIHLLLIIPSAKNKYNFINSGHLRHIQSFFETSHTFTYQQWNCYMLCLWSNWLWEDIHNEWTPGTSC